MDSILTAIVPCLSIPNHPGITLRQVDHTNNQLPSVVQASNQSQDIP